MYEPATLIVIFYFIATVLMIMVCEYAHIVGLRNQPVVGPWGSDGVLTFEKLMRDVQNLPPMPPTYDMIISNNPAVVDMFPNHSIFPDPYLPIDQVILVDSSAMIPKLSPPMEIFDRFRFHPSEIDDFSDDFEVKLSD